MKEIIIKVDEKPRYSIVLTDTFDKLTEKIREAGLSPDKIALLSDTNTTPLYAKAVKDELEALAPVTNIIIPAGEEYKNLDTVTSVYDQLVEAHFTRKSLMVSLGGGVCGDMTGFISATFMRGIPFVQIPTTLLSQVDASIGGKTGFDYKGYKNMIGAFHMPSLVYINMSVLRSLPEREIRSGMAEIIKAGLILDRPYYEWLKDNKTAINDMNMSVYTEMVFHACKIKQQVVEEDPFEKGKRMLLNFGHTLGHAVERGLDFTMTHGECVGLGMLYAAYISMKKGLLSQDELTDICHVCEAYQLPRDAAYPENGIKLDADVILKNASSDKKVQHGVIKFILLRSIGDAFVSNDVTADEMTEAIEYFRGKEVRS